MLKSNSGSKSYDVYIGTYAAKEKTGIYQYTYDAHTGELTYADSVSGVLNPSYLTVNRTGNRLYSVSETTDDVDGGVVSFRIHPETGKLTRINEQSTKGSAPCYLETDAHSQFLVVANYGGSACAFPLMEDGQIGTMSDWIDHAGHSIRTDRQGEPHPHSAVVSPSNQYVLVPDLGVDKVYVYKLDAETYQLTAFREISVTSGAGPRHLVFHPTGRFAYLINELDNTIIGYSVEEEIGNLKEIQTISTLPADFAGVSYAADIHITPDGKYLYGSNRGHDSIAAYAILDDGQLKLIEYKSCGGRNPRNFAIDLDGKHLLVANQDSNLVVSFKIDANTGRLMDTGHTVSVDRPVCIKFGPSEL